MKHRKLLQVEPVRSASPGRGQPPTDHSCLSITRRSAHHLRHERAGESRPTGLSDPFRQALPYTGTRRDPTAAGAAAATPTATGGRPAPLPARTARSRWARCPRRSMSRPPRSRAAAPRPGRTATMRPIGSTSSCAPWLNGRGKWVDARRLAAGSPRRSPKARVGHHARGGAEAQALEIAIDALDIPAVLPFWWAASVTSRPGRSPGNEMIVVDPAGRAHRRFRQLHAQRPEPQPDPLRPDRRRG